MVVIARHLGWELMPWQVLVVMVALEVQTEEAGDPEPGMWAYLEVVVTVQRQAGKTTLVVPVLAHAADQKPHTQMWMTAQSRDKAVDRWSSLTEVLLGSPLGPRLHRKVSHSHETCVWRSGAGVGSYLRPFAPGRDGKNLHGDTPDKVVVDELWAFDAAEASALRQAYEPGFSTVNGQAWLLSTAGTAASAWLNGARRRGRAAVEAGEQHGIAYFEWSVPEEVGGIDVLDLDDESLLELVLAHHPAAGITVRIPLLRQTLRTATEDVDGGGRAEWLRAYGNYPGKLEHGGLIAPRALDAGLVNRQIPGDVRVAIGFEVDLEREESTIVAGWRGPDGHALTEVIDWREGSTWLAGRVAAIVETHAATGVHLVCGNAGPTRDVADRLEQLGLEVQRVAGADWFAACSRWLSESTAVREGTLIPEPTVRHDGHPRYLTAVRRARTRRVGESTVVVRPEGQPITAVPATIAALWGADHLPELEDLGPFTIR